MATPLETQLLAAFDDLASAHAEQHADSLSACEDLRQMFESTREENAELRAQVQSLATQVRSLSAALKRLGVE